jgi:hypothetical protein
MRRAIIHIGTTKTGTTSIQRVLGLHRDQLLAQGACYPVSPGALEHVKLHGWMAQRRRSARKRGPVAAVTPQARELDEFPAAFAREMEGLPASIDRVMLSEERLSTLRTGEEIGALKDFLAPFFDSFQIVVYLRSQDSYLASRYSELLRMGKFEGPDNVVATRERLWHYDYHALIGRWAEVFGADAITPRLYGRGPGKSFDSVDDFLTLCGLTVDLSKDSPARKRNESISFAGQELMLRVAELIRRETGEEKISPSLWFEISAAVSIGLPGKGWLPTRDEAAAFMKRFEAGNEAIRARYFPERTILFDDASSRFPVTPMVVDQAAVLEAACMALFRSAARSEGRLRSRKEAGVGARANAGAEEEEAVAAGHLEG